MGEPTIYRRPTTILPGHPAKPRDAEKWKKHRERKGQDVRVPKSHKS